MFTAALVFIAAAAGFLLGLAAVDLGIVSQRMTPERSALIHRLVQHWKYLRAGTAVQGGAADILQAIEMLGGRSPIPRAPSRLNASHAPHTASTPGR